jgi:hypothetical protein
MKLAILALLLVAILCGGCVINFFPYWENVPESEDNEEQKYKVEVDYMAYDYQYWSQDADVFAPRLDYLGRHVTENGIAVVETLSERGTIYYFNDFAHEVEALDTCYNHWDRCSGGAVRHSFHILGADNVPSNRYTIYGTTDVSSGTVRRRSVVFVGNIADALIADEEFSVEQLNLLNSRTSLHELGLQMMGDNYLEHPVETHWSSCVMCSVAIRKLYDVPGFCGSCWSIIAEEEDDENWVPEIECSTLLLADTRADAGFARSMAFNTCRVDSKLDLTVQGEVWRRRTLPIGDFEGIPDTSGGLKLQLDVLKDTLLLDEPIIAEILLTNVSNHDAFDQLLFESIDRRLRVYALHAQGSVLDLDTGFRRTMLAPDFFRIPPGTIVRVPFAIGNLGVAARGRSAGFTAPEQFFSAPGWYKLFAAYTRRAPDERGRGRADAEFIVSDVDSFFVRMPEGTEAVVHEAAFPQVDEIDVNTLEAIYRDNAASVYSPYLIAIRAHRLSGRPGGRNRFIERAGALEELFVAYPDHILTELARFDYAFYTGLSGDTDQANSLLEELMATYPGNPNIYFRFEAGGTTRLLEDLTIRGGHNESGTAVE